MTKSLIKPLLIVVFAFVGSFVARAQDTFRGIIPFITTRSEVAKLLGKPNSTNRYELDDGRATVRYVEAARTPIAASCISLAPVGTVRSIEFEPYTDVKIEYLYLDPKLWRRLPVSGGHVPGFEVYISDSKGITYTVDTKSGFVTWIDYDESEETCGILRRRAAKQAVDQ